MAYGQPSWVIEELLMHPDDQAEVVSWRIEETWYGSTSGPWGGIGGAAMSPFTMTMIEFRDGFVVYADKRRMGRVRPEYLEELLQLFPYVRREWFDATD